MGVVLFSITKTQIIQNRQTDGGDATEGNDWLMLHPLYKRTIIKTKTEKNFITHIPPHNPHTPHSTYSRKLYEKQRSYISAIHTVGT